MARSVCILDYGSGNVKSVYNLLQELTPNVKISNSPHDMEEASHLILPGVGAFGAAMRKVKEKIPMDPLREQVFGRRKPFLGICVGMQVLATRGIEFGSHEGLGWIPGEVGELSTGEFPLPHIGWNDISVTKEAPLMRELNRGVDFYFLHSFAFRPEDPSLVLATAEYGERFCSAIHLDNIMGVQFHPEKSQRAGKILMGNFLSLEEG